MQKQKCTSECRQPLVFFGCCYKAQRLRRGMTQAQVVEHLALCSLVYAERNTCWVSRVESGLVPRLSRATVDDLAVALGCDRRDRAAFLIAAGFWPLAEMIPTSWAECRRLATELLQLLKGGRSAYVQGGAA